MKKHFKYRKQKKHTVDPSLLAMVILSVLSVALSVTLALFALRKYVISQPISALQTQQNDQIYTQETEQSSKVDAPQQTTVILRPNGVGITENYRAKWVDLSQCQTEEQVLAAAYAAVQQGYTAVWMDAKTAAGHMQYRSEILQAQAFGLASGVVLSPAQLIQIFHQAGLFVTVRVCAFCDAAAAQDPSMALQSVEGDVWRDESGTWCSVASLSARTYISSLVEELDLAGADEICLCHFAYPVTAAGNLSVAAESRTDTVTAWIARLQESLQGATLTLQMCPVSFVSGISQSTGIDLPALAAYAGVFVLDCTGGKMLTDNLRIATAAYRMRLLVDKEQDISQEGFLGIQYFN